MYNLSVLGKEASEKLLRKPSHVKINIYDDFNAATQSGNCIFEIDTSVAGRDNNIIEATWDTEVDLINSKLPTADFTFRFADVEKRYNPELSEGDWRAIERQLPCCFYFGYTLEDNSVEWIKCGTYITTGQNEWDISNYIPIITITAKSLIYFLTNEIDISTVNGSTYYEAANSIFEYAKANNEFLKNEWFTVIVPEELKKYSLNGCFEEGQTYVVNEAFQLLAQASTRQLFIDRSGNVVFLTISTEPVDFHLGYEKISNPPSITRYPILKNFRFMHSQPVASEEYEALLTPFTLLSSTAVSEQYPSYGYSVSMYISSGYSPTILEIDVGEFAEICFYGYNSKSVLYEYAVFSSSDYEAKTSTIKYSDLQSDALSCIFERTGATTFRLTLSTTSSYGDDFSIYIKIKNWTTEVTETTIERASDIVGEDCNLENIFVSSEAQANTVIEYLTEILQLRNEYDGVENRGYPELDVADMITAETAYSASIDVFLLGNRVTYNGGISGKCKYLLCVK